jgi:hypothetical protein
LYFFTRSEESSAVASVGAGTIMCGWSLASIIYAAKEAPIVQSAIFVTVTLMRIVVAMASAVGLGVLVGWITAETADHEEPGIALGLSLGLFLLLTKLEEVWEETRLRLPVPASVVIALLCASMTGLAAGLALAAGLMVLDVRADSELAVAWCVGSGLLIAASKLTWLLRRAGIIHNPAGIIMRVITTAEFSVGTGIVVAGLIAVLGGRGFQDEGIVIAIGCGLLTFAILAQRIVSSTLSRQRDNPQATMAGTEAVPR